MKPLVIGGLSIALLVGGFWFLVWSENPNEPEELPVDLSEADTPVAPRVVWESAVVREDAFGMPVSEVHATIAGTRYDMGTAEGTCAEMTENLLINEASAYVCWFAGAGTEFGLFERGGTVTLEKGVIEEGSAEVEGYRGDFTIIHTISFN